MIPPPIPTPHPSRISAQRQAAQPAPAPLMGGPKFGAPARSSSSMASRVREHLRADPLAAPAWVAALALAGMCLAVGWWTLRAEIAIWRAGRVIEDLRTRNPFAGGESK